MNGLMEAIQTQVDPFYQPPVEISEKKNRLYVFQYPLNIMAAEMGLRPYAFFIGQTDPSRGWIVEGEMLTRWGDGDYTKSAEKPKLLEYVDVHEDILDHDIRMLMRKYGWVKELPEYPGYGSHEMVMHPSIKDWTTGLKQFLIETQKLDEYYKEHTAKYGYSPGKKKKQAKKKEDEMYRIPDRELLMDMCDEMLKKVAKYAKIYVIQDAHGHICDYLLSKGYNNLYTEKSYKYFPKGELAKIAGLDRVNLLTDKQIDKMDFDVVIGNPPYQDSSNNDIASNLWSKFWVKALSLTKDDGIVSLITPFSWCSPSQDFKKLSDAYEGDRRLWDTFNRFTSVADVENVKQYFPGVGSTFSRVTVYKSGNDGLSFSNPKSNAYLDLGFHPQSGDIEEILPFFDKEENLKKYFKMDEEGRSKLKVSIPKTKLFYKDEDADRVQILQPHQVGTSGSKDPRNYFYIYVDSLEQAEEVKQIILNAKDIICKHCRWAGFLNLKVVEYLKYVPKVDVQEQAQ